MGATDDYLNQVSNLIKQGVKPQAAENATDKYIRLVREGNIYDPSKDVLRKNAEAMIEGVLPITRPIVAAAAASDPGNPYLAAANPYAGKDPLATGLATGADVVGTAANLAMPAKGFAAQALKFGIPALTAVTLKKAAELLSTQKWFQNTANSKEGKIFGDYIMPTASIILGGKALHGAIKTSQIPNNLSEFLQDNPTNIKNMSSFPNNINDLNNNFNQSKALKDMGFDSSAGKRGAVGEDLYKSIKDSIQAEKANYKANFDKIQGVSVPKETIKGIVDKMNAEIKNLKYSEPDIALKNDIVKYKDILIKLKKPTIAELDDIKDGFRQDAAVKKNTFLTTYNEALALSLEKELSQAIENSVPAIAKKAFQEAKGTYATMAEARREINNAANASADQIMQKMSNGDRLSAVERLASAEKINAAMRANSHFKHPGDNAAMIKDYLENLRKIDSTNPELAKKIYTAAPTPIFNDRHSSKLSLLGNIPETAATETNKTMQNKKRADEIRKGLKIMGVKK